MSLFSQHGEQTNSTWFNNLADQLLKKFSVDDEGYKFAFMDIFLRIKLNDNRGGGVNFRFPVKNFFPSSEIDDLRLDFKMDDLGRILFDLNFEYDDRGAFPYKNFVLRNVQLSRNVSDGCWQNRIVVDEDTQPIELKILTCEDNMLNITFTDYRGTSIDFDFGFQQQNKATTNIMEAKLSVNDATYRFEADYDLDEMKLLLEFQMPNNYLDALLYFDIDSRPTDSGEDQYVTKLNMGVKKSNNDVLKMKNLLKVIPFGAKKSIQLSMDINNQVLIFDGMVDIQNMNGSLALSISSEYSLLKELTLNVLLDQTYDDRWKFKAAGNIETDTEKELKINAYLKHDMSNGALNVIYDGTRLAQFNAREIRIDDSVLTNASLVFSFLIVGTTASGRINYEKTFDHKTTGVLSLKSSPMKAKFALNIYGQGCYNIKTEFVGDDGTTYGFFQTHEKTPLHTLWTQTHVLNGTEIRQTSWRLLDNAFYVNIYELNSGTIIFKMDRQVSLLKLFFKIEPNGFEDAKFSIHLKMNDALAKVAGILSKEDDETSDEEETSPDDTISREDMNPENDDFGDEVDYYYEPMGEMKFLTSLRMKRGDNLVFSDLFEIDLTNTDETMFIAVSTITKYSKEFFAYEAVCQMYGLSPSNCFTREKTRFHFFLDKSVTLYGVVSPLEVGEVWEHDGSVTMAISLTTTDNPIVFNLYLPYSLPALVNDTTMIVEADINMEDQQMVAKTNFQDMKLEIIKNGNVYQTDFTRYGRTHLNMVTNVYDNYDLYDLYGTMNVNYFQKKNSLITQTLCTGPNCYERVLIDVEYALDLALHEYSADINLYTEELKKDLEEEDDTFMLPFMRMNHELNKIQEEDTIDSEFTEIEAQIEEKLAKEDRSEEDGTKISMIFSLPTSSFVLQLNTEDKKFLNSLVDWSNSTATIEVFEDLLWNTKSQFTADWSTKEIKSGFLISQDVNLDPYEKMLLQTQDVGTLVDPTASFSTIGKQSLYGIGVIGYPESHFLAGQIQHWERDDFDEAGLDYMEEIARLAGTMIVNNNDNNAETSESE